MKDEFSCGHFSCSSPNIRLEITGRFVFDSYSDSAKIEQVRARYMNETRMK